MVILLIMLFLCPYYPIIIKIAMKFLLSFTLFIFSFAINAQSLNGIVNDADGKASSEVLIRNLNSKTHAHSDANGKFTLEGVQVNDSLVITKKGFSTQKIKLTSLDFLTISLEEKPFLLEEVKIGNNLKYLNTISKIDFEIQPISNSQDLLRKVPGLFIGQHAGGGKAEQIFLRGFDCDHGTDINITVDGMPVNMVSHAHGQGYSDLHFVIPETVDNIDFDKIFNIIIFLHNNYIKGN